MTLPPSFPLELENSDNERHIRRENERRIEKVLQEVIPNPRMVGKGGFAPIVRYWQPHNYRLYFDFDTKTFNPTQVGFEPKNYNSEYHSKELILGCKIIIRKKQAEVINRVHEGVFFKLIAQSMQDIDNQVINIINKLDSEASEALLGCMRQYGGVSTLTVLKRYKNENKLKGDEVLDSIPRNMVIQDYPFFKKVYEDHTEIYGLEKFRTFMRNRIVEQVSPEISHEIADIKLNMFTLKEIKKMIKKQADFNIMLDASSGREILNLLTASEKAELSEYIFSICDE